MQLVLVLQHISLYEVIGGMLLMCQNTTMRVNGAWLKTCYALCSKTLSTFGNMLQCTVSSREATRSTCICETCLFSTQFMFNWGLNKYKIRYMRHGTGWYRAFERRIRFVPFYSHWLRLCSLRNMTRTGVLQMQINSVSFGTSSYN